MLRNKLRDNNTFPAALQENILERRANMLKARSMFFDVATNTQETETRAQTELDKLATGLDNTRAQLHAIPKTLDQLNPVNHIQLYLTLACNIDVARRRFEMLGQRLNSDFDQDDSGDGLAARRSTTCSYAVRMKELNELQHDCALDTLSVFDAWLDEMENALKGERNKIDVEFDRLQHEMNPDVVANVSNILNQDLAALSAALSTLETLFTTFAKVSPCAVQKENFRKRCTELAKAMQYVQQTTRMQLSTCRERLMEYLATSKKLDLIQNSTNEAQDQINQITSRLALTVGEKWQMFNSYKACKDLLNAQERHCFELRQMKHQLHDQGLASRVDKVLEDYANMNVTLQEATDLQHAYAQKHQKLTDELNKLSRQVVLVATFVSNDMTKQSIGINAVQNKLTILQNYTDQLTDLQSSVDSLEELCQFLEAETDPLSHMNLRISTTYVKLKHQELCETTATLKAQTEQFLLALQKGMERLSHLEQWVVNITDQVTKCLVLHEHAKAKKVALQRLSDIRDEMEAMDSQFFELQGVMEKVHNHHMLNVKGRPLMKKYYSLRRSMTEAYSRAVGACNRHETFDKELETVDNRIRSEVKDKISVLQKTIARALPVDKEKAAEFEKLIKEYRERVASATESLMKLESDSAQMCDETNENGQQEIRKHFRRFKGVLYRCKKDLHELQEKLLPSLPEQSELQDHSST